MSASEFVAGMREAEVMAEAFMAYRPPRIPYMSIRSVTEAYIEGRISVEGFEVEVERLLLEGEGVEYSPRYLRDPRYPTDASFVEAFKRPYR